MTLLTNFIDLFLDSAPWLLLGLILASLIKMFVPMSWMHQQLGGHGLTTTIKAALFGAPLPLCSCGVIPAAIGLRRAGASKAATTSFLVSTPETGVDSVSISYVLLGPFMAIVRPIAAVLSAIVAGLLVGHNETESPLADDNRSAVPSGCCKNKPQESTNEKRPSSITAMLIKVLRYAATDLVRDTTVWLLVGLFFAALVQTYVPSDFMAKWGDGILAMLVMVLVSVPMYICATASTPIAAGLLLAGVSPGAVLVFMLAGPATNIATLGVVTKELGKRALYGYLGGVLGVALIAGIIVNYLVATFGFEVMPQVGDQYNLLPASVVYTSGVILAVLMGKVLLEKFSSKA